MLNKLGELFNIGSGLVTKRKEAPPNISGFKYKTLTLRSVSPLGFIDEDSLDDFVSIEEVDEKYVAKAGDIIVRLSSPFTAAVIDEKIAGAIITSLFAIFKSKNNILLPEYVAILLNSEWMKKQYTKDASGSALQMIKTSSIKDYGIAIPDLEKQSKIININQLMKRELTLLEDLTENKKIYNKMLLNKLMED